MAYNYLDFPDGTPVFTHVYDNGANIHIYAEGLRQHLMAHPCHIVDFPIEDHRAMAWITSNIVNPVRVLMLEPHHLRHPVIICKDHTFTDGKRDVLYVDGHHRYVRAAYDHRTSIRAFMVPPRIWEPFLIEGMPDFTQEQLRDIPVTMRSY